MANARPGKRAVLYSGGQERRNALIHTSLLDLALRRPHAARRRRVRIYLEERCVTKNIKLMVSCFDLKSLHELSQNLPNLEVNKVPSAFKK